MIYVQWRPLKSFLIFSLIYVHYYVTHPTGSDQWWETSFLLPPSTVSTWHQDTAASSNISEKDWQKLFGLLLLLPVMQRFWKRLLHRTSWALLQPFSNSLKDVHQVISLPFCQSFHTEKRAVISFSLYSMCRCSWRDFIQHMQCAVHL